MLNVFIYTAEVQFLCIQKHKISYLNLNQSKYNSWFL